MELEDFGWTVKDLPHVKNLVVVLVAQVFVKHCHFILDSSLQTVNHQVLVLHLLEEVSRLANLFNVLVVGLGDDGEHFVNFFPDLLLCLVNFLLDLL